MTGTLPVSERLVGFVESAFAHIRTMAFLPGSEEADQIVERLMARREEYQRPLIRRLSKDSELPCAAMATASHGSYRRNP